MLRLISVFVLAVCMSLWLKLVKREAIFVPLPKQTIRKMLKLAKVDSEDLVYDLGSGDGRVVIIAAREFGARAVGIERNWLLYKLSKWKVAKQKLNERVKIIRGDFFKKKISDATVIIVYLTQKLNDRLEPKLLSELKRGTRVVSASHEFKNLKERERIKTGHFYSYLYEI